MNCDIYHTTKTELRSTQALGQGEACAPPEILVGQYQRIIEEQRLNWTAYHRLQRLLGVGSQGKVFLSERRGADAFTLPVALKFFSPESFTSEEHYQNSMEYTASIAAQVAQIQHDNLLDVYNFVERNQIRVMVMEWIDGYDLRQLISSDRLHRLQKEVADDRWEYINRVIATPDTRQMRFKPGMAVAIVRDCLDALGALHRNGIVHGDIKPANIMLKKTGDCKIIDIGSSFRISDPPQHRSCTPAYAAPEVLTGELPTQKSDLASLGYTLIELLIGRSLFEGLDSYAEILKIKRELPEKLSTILPADIAVNPLLTSFCKQLIMVDPQDRFPTAEVAELHKNGAAAFHRQLVKGDLSSEYNNELRLWINELQEIDRKAEKKLKERAQSEG
ncbi:MAG: serine/threonine protein kinase [Pirellulaceae bacterium]|nr:serine/threonine protein kinase [Pirellulaceae bacterium]